MVVLLAVLRQRCCHDCWSTVFGIGFGVAAGLSVGVSGVAVITAVMVVTGVVFWCWLMI